MELSAVRKHDVKEDALTADWGDVIEFENHGKHPVFVEPADRQLIMALPEQRDFQPGYPFENVETIPVGGVACLRVRSDIKAGTYYYQISDAVTGPDRGDIKNITVPCNAGRKPIPRVSPEVHDVSDSGFLVKPGEIVKFKDRSGKNHKIEKVNLKQHKELSPDTDITYPYVDEKVVGPQGADMYVSTDLSSRDYIYQIGPKPEDIKSVTVP